MRKAQEPAKRLIVRKTLYLTKDNWDWLERQAQADDRSASSYLDRAIKQMVESAK